MLYKYIINLLSVEGKVKINVNEKDYMVNSLPSGLCLFKVLAGGSYLFYNATSGMIRTQLSNLDNYLSQKGNNIVKLKSHIKTLINTLTSRG